MHDPLIDIVQVIQANSELFAIVAQCIDLLLGNRIGDRQTAIGRGNIVIRGRHSPLRSPHFPTSDPQPLKSLSAGDLMNQMQIDV